MVIDSRPFPFMGIHIPILGFIVLIDYISPPCPISLNEDGTSFAPKRLNKWIRIEFFVNDL